jgi:lipoic acid synthetase
VSSALRVRWLGRVPYREAEALQRALHGRSHDDYLLLLEHPHVYTLGSRAKTEHLLFDSADSVGAELVVADRGGDVTYHGPGQLVGYPIVSLAEWRAGQRDVVAYVRALEQVLIDALADLDVVAHRSEGYTGVWVETSGGEEKLAAIGVRVANGRTRHGFALNVDPDLSMFDHIVPCGIADRGVTSLGRLLGSRAPSMQTVAGAVTARFLARFGYDAVERSDVVWRERPEDLAPFTRAAAHGETPVRLIGRLAEAGVVADPTPRPKDRPAWMRVKATMGPEYLELKKLVRGLGLHTVCEEAGCPNIYECWSQRTATFMILGDRCTRACGFCLVDTRKPEPVDRDEPRRVAEAVAVMGLEHVVITCVARDDLPDGGASVFAATVDAIRAAAPSSSSGSSTTRPTPRVELLISDCRGDAASLDTIFAARPDVLNHNLETVARLQRAARPSAGYARSLAVLGRAKDAELVTKSGLILGMGETEPEVRAAMADLRGVGVDILTLGQYLRPTRHHLPVVRWWTPEEFEALHQFGASLGFAHVEAGPLVRSSYHARDGVVERFLDDEQGSASLSVTT